MIMQTKILLYGLDVVQDLKTFFVYLDEVYMSRVNNTSSEGARVDRTISVDDK